MNIPTIPLVITDPTKTTIWLRISVSGQSGSGKTYSALRLATGIQRVSGGKIFGIDTENGRMMHYHKSRMANGFDFQHVSFPPPFGPLRYLAMFKACVDAGAGVIVVDNMSHEHNGIGGVLSQAEEFLDRKCGDDQSARDRNNQLAYKQPKAERRYLNNAIQQMNVHIVFIYQAEDKAKPVPGQGIKHVGWSPLTTSPLLQDMTQTFLLAPASDGYPMVNPKEDAERRLVKNPAQFRGWFSDGMQLNEELGEKMARWSVPTNVSQSSQPSPKTPKQGLADWMNTKSFTVEQKQTLRGMFTSAETAEELAQVRAKADEFLGGQ